MALVHYPDVQKRIQEEIERVVGDERLPGLEDRAEMPYSHAAMLETFRYFSTVPLPGPRCTTADVIYKGYTIPKRTMV